MDVGTHYSQVCNSTQVEWKDANAIAFLWTYFNMYFIVS
jgi:hypothetical protein